MATPRHPSRPKARLAPRAANNEHVVLADCRDPTGKLSSQAAYFNGSITNTPQDIAVVQTLPGQTAIWFNHVTAAEFTATGVVFTATLNGKGVDGDFVGTGDNGYGSFNCYQSFYKDRYTYNNDTCNMVVDCNHSAPAATPSPSPVNNNAGNRGLSTGAIIGISVGAGIACIMLALVSGWFLWRHYRSSRLQNSTSLDPEHTGESLDPNKKLDASGQPAEVFELPGSYQSNEMTTDNVRAELGGVARVEMELKPERFSFDEGVENDAEYKVQALDEKKPLNE